MPTTQSEVWTVKRLLDWTVPYLDRRGVDSPRLSAEMLLGHVLELKRIQLYTDHDRPLTADELGRFRDLVKRAGDHEPIAHLVGHAPFFNLDFTVTRDTLVPRPDTETIVTEVLQRARRGDVPAAARVVDVCTGSGCVAVALAKNLPEATVLATDLSEPAAEVARGNAEKHGVSDRVTVEVGDLLAPAAGGEFDLIVGNPPYIATGQLAGLDRNVRDYEPTLALDGGADGLDPHRRLLADAPPLLVAGGGLLLEIAHDQADAARSLAAEHADAFGDPTILRDMAGRPRVLSLVRV